MRLTNRIRDNILSSVMNSTNFNQRKNELKKATALKIREVIQQQVPAEFRTATASLSQNWFSKVDEIYSRHTTFHFEPIAIPYDFIEYTERSCPDLRGIYDDYETEINKIREAEGIAKTETRKFLYSCKSANDILKVFPEFERHIPKNSVAYPLVVSVDRMKTALVDSGFDTGVK